ncbi:MAG: hypothetical protein WDA24_01645 [Tissierellales bacterium]
MRKVLYLSLVVIMIVGASITNISLANPDSADVDKTILEVQESLTSISVEEQEVLERLFILSQEIEEMDNQNLQITKEMEDLKEEVENIEKMIEIETISYYENLDMMEDVLKAYQRSGPGSFLELILGSDSLKVLLQRLNALSNITRNTNNLLESLDESKTKLDIEKNKSKERLLAFEEQQKKLEEILEKNINLKEELEVYLDSLKGERNKYENYLAEIEQYWIQLRPLFSETISIFSSMLYDTNLPPEAIKVELSLLRIKGIIEEKMFREIISNQSFPTKIEVEFSPDKLEIIMPDIDLYLAGSFEIVDNKRLLFLVNEGSFYGLPLEKNRIEDLFSEGNIEIDLGQFLGKNKLKAIKINEDNIEIQITPVFF